MSEAKYLELRDRSVERLKTDGQSDQVWWVHELLYAAKNFFPLILYLYIR